MTCWNAIFARHGVTDWNRDRRYLGHASIPLNEMGRFQAFELGRALAGYPLDRIFSSDLARARETADIVHKTLYQLTGKKHDIIADKRLREMDFGLIEGMTYEEGMGHYPELMTQWIGQWEAKPKPLSVSETISASDAAGSFPPPGGQETTEQVLTRMKSFMKDTGACGYDRVLIISHSGAIRLWLSYRTNVPFWEISLHHGGWFEHEVYGEEEEFE